MDPLLLSFLFIVETVLIPYGVTKCRLRHYIHPSLLAISVLFFVGETLVRWVLLLVPVPADLLGSSISTGRVILAVFRLFKGWVIGLFLILTNSVTAPDHQGSAVEGDQEYYSFHDCSDQDQCYSSEDVEVEILDPAGTVVPCDHDQYWHDADHEQGSACRSVVLSSDYASTVLPANANVIVQQYRQKECFVEEGCIEWGKTEGEREAATVVISCRDVEEQRRYHGDPSALHENMLQPAANSEAIWSEQLNDHVVALPMILQIGSAEEESKPSDSSTTESDQSEGGVELDDVILTFPFLRLTTEAGILEGVAEDQEPDPAAFINIIGSQLDADHDELDVQERELAASSFWAPIEYWNEDASEEGDDALQAAAETSLAIRVLEERDGQHDMFYGQYTKKMGWFDRLNCERIHQASALLKMDILDLSIQEKIESKIRSLQGTTAGYLIRGVERDLEHVYVAQSCLCWAVLRDQYYMTVESTLASSSNISAGPALISRGNAAGKFQQFRVLLHRYMENECREVKRYWSYCSSRFSASNLLQVPDVSSDDKAAGEITATASDHMLEAIEKAIQVFWDFLESDNCRPSGKVLKKLLRTHDHPQVDDARDLDLLHNLKKEVRKKDKWLKNLQKTRCLWWKKTTPKVLVETRRIKMLFKLIEVKLVSRVLSMSSISTHQLRWCQDMMESVDIINNGREMRFCNGNFLFPSS